MRASIQYDRVWVGVCNGYVLTEGVLRVPHGIGGALRVH